MNTTGKHIILLLLVGFMGISACNDDLTIETEQINAKIVVDGWIDNGAQARVFLTTNSNYFSSIDSASIRDLVLTRAKVTLSDGDNSEVLILRKDSRYFPPYYYAGNTLFGEEGKNYTLTAEYGGKSVIAHTTIPSVVEIDTSYFEFLDGSDSLGSAVIEFTDPPYEKNYYRIFTKRLGKDDRFISSVIIAIDDQFFNGKEISFAMYRSPESFLSTEGSQYFLKGDTVVMKLCTMDERTFNFWDTYQDEVVNATNPFASSMIDLESNIEGDGLGIWGGYGVSLDTIEGVFGGEAKRIRRGEVRGEAR